MVVVEGASDRVGAELDVEVTSVLQPGHRTASCSRSSTTARAASRTTEPERLRRSREAALRGFVLLLAAGEGTTARRAATEGALRPRRRADRSVCVRSDRGRRARRRRRRRVCRPVTKRIESLVGSDRRNPSVVVVGGAIATGVRSCGARRRRRRATRSSSTTRRVPLAPASLFDACLRELDECDAVCPGRPARRHDQGDGRPTIIVRRSIGRSSSRAQTPQGFRAEVYRRAHEAALADGFDGTDDAALVERIGVTRPDHPRATTAT